jgi:beta-glucosidase
VRVTDLVDASPRRKSWACCPPAGAGSRLGLREYHVGGEAAMCGGTGTDTTVFPQTLGMAMTWDRDLLHRIGEVVGTEARALYRKNGEIGGLTRWAPTVDLERDPRWGRTEEAYGEDPFLTGQLASAYVRGMQGSDPTYLRMSAALNHLYANNNEHGRCWLSVSVPPREKREYYLKAFEAPIREGGARSIMPAYNEINGVPCITNPEVRDIVQGEWGMDGFVVCDGGDFGQTVDMHKTYPDHAPSMADTLRAGVDCITDHPEVAKQAARDALSGGWMAEADLDAAISRTLSIRFRLGEFDPPKRNPHAAIPADAVCLPESAELAREAVRKSVVLLRNSDGFLPLKPRGLQEIAVVGPLAQVVYKDWYTGQHPYKITPLDGIRERADQASVHALSGGDRVRFKSVKTGRWRALDMDTGVLRCAADENEAAALFERTDWGWNRQTLKAVDTGKYLTLVQPEGVKAEGQAVHPTTSKLNGREAEYMAATAGDIWGWFVREQITLVPEPDGTCLIKTWDHRYLCVSAAGIGVCDTLPDPEAGRFRMEVVEDGVARAAACARDADVAVVVVGNNPIVNAREEYDRSDIVLPPEQERLIHAVHAANPRTVVIVIGSYPFAIGRVDAAVPAILYCAHGGQELGHGLADVLFGDFNPAARLNMTWYRHVSQLPDMMEYRIIDTGRTYLYFDGPVLYPFGYGLSYTTFSYANLQVTAPEQGVFRVSFEVTNIGTTAGEEVPQLYLRALTSRVKRPNRQLAGFERLALAPGETRTVVLAVNVADLALWDVTRNRYCVETANWQVLVGASSADIRLEGGVAIQGETIPPRNPFEAIAAMNYDDMDAVYLDRYTGSDPAPEPVIHISCVRCRHDEGWLVFRDMDFEAGATAFDVQMATATAGGAIEVRLDDPAGEPVGRCDAPGTGGWQCWKTRTGTVSGVSGRHDVYLRLQGRMALAWLRFNR